MKKQKLLHVALRIKYIAETISQKVKMAAISAYAGQSAFFLMLSFFPFLMFIFALLKYTPFDKSAFITIANMFLPNSFHMFISDIINDIYEHQPSTLLPITIIMSVWMGSKSFLTLIQGMNSVNKINESRNFFVIRFFSLIYTVLFAILILATLAIMVFGNTIYHFICRHFPLLDNTILSIISIRPVVSFLIMCTFFTIMYIVLPNRKTRFSTQIPGAIIASCGWMAFSYLYSFYVDNFSNYSTFYGTMTIIALLMVWLYACMYILFLGSFINSMLE